MNWLLLKNSLLVSGLTTLLAVSLGFIAALWVCGLAPHWRNRMLALAIMAVALPPFLVTNCWLHFFGYSGVWRAWLPLNIFSLGGTVWILTLLTWPFTLLAVWAAWQRLEPAQLECDTRVTGWALIRGLLLPLARTAMLLAAVLTFVLALNNFSVPAILQVKVLPAELWIRFNTTFDMAGAMKLSWPLVIAPLLLLAWFMRRSLPWPRVEGGVSPRLFRQQLGKSWFCACGALTVTMCAFAVGLPLGQIALAKRTWVELPGAIAAGQSAMWNSFWFAALAAAVVVGLALAVAAGGAHGTNALTTSRWQALSTRVCGQNAGGTLLWLPFLAPGVLLGIGLIAFFNRPVFTAFYQGAGIVILAFAVRYLALGWMAARHAMRTVDSDLTDAARLSGASRWQLLRHIHWPQIAPQVAVAWYIVFLLCLWDVESMILIVPPGGETLALRVFNLLHYGHNAQVNALCLTLLGLAVAPLAIWRVVAMFSTHNPQPTTHNPVFGVWCLAFGVCFVFSGCAPKLSPNEAPVKSQLFDRVQIIGSRGAGAGELNKPRSVAVDGDDNLFVVDMTGRVQKFSPDGVFLLSWQMPETDVGRAKGLCRDRDGNIVIVEPHYARVNHFRPDGTLAMQWGEHGRAPGQLGFPRAAAVNSRNEIFVSEYSASERVQKFVLEKRDGVAPSLQIVFGKGGNGPGDFNRAEGLCVDAQDRVYVADSCNHRIQVFSSDGRFIRAYGKAGSGMGELSYPYDIRVDEAGRQYVCEFGNSRIQVFDSEDRPIEVIGGPGVEPGRFGNPWSLDLDSTGNLYVADSQNHRVQKFIRSPGSRFLDSESRSRGSESKRFADATPARSGTGTQSNPESRLRTQDPGPSR